VGRAESKTKGKRSRNTTLRRTTSYSPKLTLSKGHQVTTSSAQHDLPFRASDRGKTGAIKPTIKSRLQQLYSKRVHQSTCLWASALRFSFPLLLFRFTKSRRCHVTLWVIAWSVLGFGVCSLAGTMVLSDGKASPQVWASSTSLTRSSQVSATNGINTPTQDTPSTAVLLRVNGNPITVGQWRDAVQQAF